MSVESTKIRIARGNLTNKTAGLAYGELFWDKASEVLYIGQGPETAGKGISTKIGGAGALRFVGMHDAGEGAPVNAQKGDFWIISAPALIGGTQYNTNDWIVCTDTSAFSRVNNTGGDAANTSFAGATEGFAATTVEGALKELAKEKLQYVGTTAEVTDFASSPVFGGMYLVSEAISVPVEASKGDFIVYDGAAWDVIPCGATSAADISFDGTGIEAAADAAVTPATQTTVAGAIGDLYANKADLGADGKVLITQLPDTVVGGMQYKGTLDLDETSAFPADAENGDYYIIAAGTAKNIDSVHYTVGDWAVFNGTSWDKIDNSETISGIQVGEDVLAGTPVIAGTEGVITVTAADNTITFNAGANVLQNAGTALTAGAVPVANADGKLVDSLITVSGSAVTMTSASLTVGTTLTVGNTKFTNANTQAFDLAIPVLTANDTIALQSDLDSVDVSASINAAISGTAGKIAVFTDTNKVGDASGISLAAGVFTADSGLSIADSAIVKNAAATGAITVTLPSVTGTLATVADIATAKADIDGGEY